MMRATVLSGLEGLVADTARLVGVDVGLVTGGSQVEAAVTARRAVVLVARRRGLRVADIAAGLGVTARAVYGLFVAADRLVRTDVDFARLCWELSVMRGEL